MGKRIIAPKRISSHYVHTEKKCKTNPIRCENGHFSFHTLNIIPHKNNNNFRQETKLNSGVKITEQSESILMRRMNNNKANKMQLHTLF